MENKLNEINFNDTMEFYKDLVIQQKVDKIEKLKQYNQNEPWLDEERLRVLLIV